MKHITKILALVLAIAMLATVMVACGDKKDDADSNDSGSSQTDNDTAGSEQSANGITVFVPDNMEFKSGTSSDPNDSKSVVLFDKEKSINYIEIILDNVTGDESSVKENLSITKKWNDEYGPSDIKITTGDNEWTGITYNASGIDCVSLYSVIGNKVYYIIAAGNAYDSDVMKAVLGSLK